MPAKLYLSLLSGVFLVYLVACGKPENLVKNKTEDATERKIESFSKTDVIHLTDTNIQLKEIKQLSQKNQSVLSLKVVMTNQNLEAGTEINDGLFSVTATQNQQRLKPVGSQKPFRLEQAKNLRYQFYLNSETDVVLFTFNYHHQQQKITKHYDAYLE